MATPIEPAHVTDALLAWFRSHRRDLPWRRRRDPYAVWISEIMLQQTQAVTAAPYFDRWMARFPDIASLAEASLDDVLKAWEGLGYYARARNIRQAAALIAAEHAGVIPSDRASLLALPGIGRYTAGAILSIAFGQAEPVLDGNVRRVLCRLYDIDEDPRRPEVEERLWDLAATLASAAPPGSAGDLNEALMELGALVCTPLRPGCPSCPMAQVCAAHLSGVEALRPIARRRPAIPTRDAFAAVIQDTSERYLFVRRPASGLLGGLWGFPSTVLPEGEQPAGQLESALREQLGIEIAVGDSVACVRHAYTHFRITLTAMRCRIVAGQPHTGWAFRWLAPAEMAQVPVAATDRKIQAALGIA